MTEIKEFSQLNLKEFIKRSVALIVCFFTRFFCLFPIDRKKIIFDAYMGTKYSCSPKFICEKFDEKNQNYKLIWIYSNKKLDCKYKQIKRNSVSYFYHSLTAGAIVINSGKNRLLFLRKSQILINTWHGGGAYKKIYSPFPVHYRQNDYFVSSCSLQDNFLFRDGLMFHGKIINSGLPRNDMLVNYDFNRANKIRCLMNVGNKKCVLYAPTYRKVRSKTEFALNYKLLVDCLKKRFGGEWVVLYRCHYNMQELSNNIQKKSIVDVTLYPDMQDLLLISDVLITDYSSSIWDFSFLKRPVFLYATDLESYYNEASFFVDIHKWPFPLCQNNEELKKKILEYDQKKLEVDVKEHHDFMGSYESGNASELLYDFINNKLMKK